MKKTFLTLIALLAMQLIPNAYAGTITIANQYPSPSGIYNWLQLTATDSPPDCSTPNHIGRFYFDLSEVKMKYCTGSLPWESFSSPWTQTGTNVHLVDPNNKVGIGTDTPEFKLTLDNDGGILAKGTYQGGATLPAGSGTRLIWYPRKAAFRAGKIDGAQWNDLNIGDSSTAFGYNNKAFGTFSSILGGQSNQILSTNPTANAVIGGGMNNIIYDGGTNAVITGGFNNQIGTLGNIISGNSATIGGGNSNKARGVGSTIAGGVFNEAGDPNNYILDFYTFVGAGRVNKAYAIESFVGGGAFNTIEATSPQSFIGGGSTNLIRAGNLNTIAGGNNNRIEAFRSTIAGGTNHLITTNDPVNTPVGNASIGGGNNNRAYGNSSTIGGGGDNIAGVLTDPTIHFGTVGGGGGNWATGVASVVAGGGSNKATAQTATVAGGNLNEANGMNSSVLGGLQNIAGGNNSAVLGGSGNQANGDASLAGGANMVISGDRTMALGYSASSMTVDQDDAIILFPLGNVGIGTTTPQQKLHIAGAVRLEPQDNPPVCDDARMGTLYVYVDGGLCFCSPGPVWDHLNSQGSCP